MMEPKLPQPFTSGMGKWFFAVCIIGALYMGYQLLYPFVVPIFMAIIITVISAPVYRAMVGLCGHKIVPAALLTCLALIMIIVIPFMLMAGIIANQALSLYYYISSQMASEQMNSALTQWLEYISPLRDALLAFGISENEIIKQLQETLGWASNILYTNVMNVLRGFTNMIINFVLIIFVTFYLLMDGRRIGLRLLSLSPMPPSLNTSIALDILHSMRTTLKGTLLLAMLQGVAGGLGLWAASVPNAPFWGTVMIFTSVVPIVGIALVWIPAAIYLLFIANNAAAILLSAWCLLVGLTCDNIIRPKLLGSGRNLHPLFTFFSVLGGLNLFGMVGLFIGPLILAILVSLLDVYERYFLSPAEPALPPQEL